MTDDEQQKSPDEKPSLWRGLVLNRLQFWLKLSMILCFILSSGLLASVIGYSMEASIFAIYARVISTACFSIFVAQEILRVALSRQAIFRYFFAHKFEFSLLFFLVSCTLVSIFSVAIAGDFDYDASLTAPEIMMHCTIVMLGIVRGLRILREISISPGLIFILSFAILIYAGTGLLLTPNAVADGASLNFIDALFFATSAVCVTGLVPVESMPAVLSQTGQNILLVLFQLGGLGVMTITYFFAFFFDGGLSIRNRFAFGDLFNDRNISQIGTTLAIVVLFTFCTETIGAIAIYNCTDFAAAGIDSPIYFSIFHSVAAFCNAGFSTVPAGLANHELSQCLSLLSSISILAVLGALGFPIVKDFALSFWSHLRRFLFPRIERLPDRLTTHTRVVVSTTLIVSIAGTLLLFLTQSPAIVQGNDTWWRSIFLAFSSRTAGFDIADTGTLGNASLFVMIVLMFIGGAPFSTAGGIKVTTFAIAMLALKQFLFGRRDLEIFGRRLNSDIANQALAIVLLTQMLCIVVTLVICALHPEISPLKVIFESVSATATVGLSCGITAQLCWGAKLCLIIAMFIGRIGVLLFFGSFIFKRTSPSNARFPETTITL